MSDKTTEGDMPEGNGGIVRNPTSTPISPERIAQIEESIRRHKQTLDELAKR